MASPATATTKTSSNTGKTTANGRSNGSTSTNRTAVASSARDVIEQKYRDFFWTYTEEPHRTRRLEIIRAHPEVCWFFCPRKELARLWN